MIYRFKSQTEGDVIMLAATGDQILKILGKEPSIQGIITVEQIPDAITALEKAVIAYETDEILGVDGTVSKGVDNPDYVSLRARAMPFIELLRNSGRSGKDVVWG